MSLKYLPNKIAIATLAALCALGPVTAEARDWRRNGPGEGRGIASQGSGYSAYKGNKDNRWGERNRGGNGYGRGSFAHGPRHDGGHRRDHTARNVAIGAFAAIVGLALAAESQRVQDEYYRD